MEREKITLNGRLFDTKSAATIFFRQMLNKYDFGEVVDESDHDFLTALVARHRHAHDLLSRKIVAFRVVKTDLYGRGLRRFEIVREDGSVNDFSYLKCISPPADAHFHDILWAMRCEVIDQTRKFHNDAFRGNITIPCSITRLPVNREDSQVDHANPFSFHVLVADFFKETGLRLDSIGITTEGPLNSCSAKYLADRDIAVKWQEYHRQHARLRISSRLANLQQTKAKGDFSEIR